MDSFYRPLLTFPFLSTSLAPTPTLRTLVDDISSDRASNVEGYYVYGGGLSSANTLRRLAAPRFNFHGEAEESPGDVPGRNNAPVKWWFTAWLMGRASSYVTDSFGDAVEHPPPFALRGHPVPVRWWIDTEKVSPRQHELEESSRCRTADKVKMSQVQVSFFENDNSTMKSVASPAVLQFFLSSRIPAWILQFYITFCSSPLNFLAPLLEIYSSFLNFTFHTKSVAPPAVLQFLLSSIVPNWILQFYITFCTWSLNYTTLILEIAVPS